MVVAEDFQLALRFRGQIKSTGLRRRVITAVGECSDRFTGDLMVRGLRERLADRL